MLSTITPLFTSAHLALLAPGMTLSSADIAAALGLAVLAGIVTTVAGMGGGLLLLLGLTTILGPLDALAVTAPALLLGNLHRAFLYRRAVDWRLVGLIVAGGLPGAVLGGLFAVAMPPWALRGLMVAMAGLVLAKTTGLWHANPPATAAVPVGAVCGAVSATSGGAGVLLGPFLMARGLSGATYVGSMASVAVMLHLGRLVAFGAAGHAGQATVLLGAGMAVVLIVGNLLGHRVRTALSASAQARVQWGALMLCVALALGASLG